MKKNTGRNILLIVMRGALNLYTEKCKKIIWLILLRQAQLKYYNVEYKSGGWW